MHGRLNPVHMNLKDKQIADRIASVKSSFVGPQWKEGNLSADWDCRIAT